MPEPADKTAALLAKLWVKIQPIVEERLVVLDRAAAAANQGALTDDLRIEARNAAHKLAGSLGMYGFDEGTRVSRELEQVLDAGAPDAARLSALVTELRGAVVPKT
jgi:HPt (histidine-containing phosphotransfer) domain-containing protein